MLICSLKVFGNKTNREGGLNHHKAIGVPGWDGLEEFI
jgi:hypothetical protein